MGIFKDENGNSYGDWAHRGQGRTRENANDIVTTGDEKKWSSPSSSSAWWCCPTKCPKPCWPLRVPSAK